METPRLRKSVKRIIQLQHNETGDVVPVTIYKRKGYGKRKNTPAPQPVEKAVRRIASAQADFANSYVDRHNRSNQDRRGGWMVDLVPNLTEAGRTRSKKS